MPPSLEEAFARLDTIDTLAKSMCRQAGHDPEAADDRDALKLPLWFQWLGAARLETERAEASS